eukprot:g6286.t1
MSVYKPPLAEPLHNSSAEHELEGIKTESISSAPVATPHPNALQLFDEYEIIGGVPAIVFKSPDETTNQAQSYFHHFAFSHDSCFMSVVSGGPFIQLYNTLNHTTEVKEPENFPTANFVYTEFRNDAIIVVNDHGVVYSVVLTEQGTSSEASLVNCIAFRFEHVVNPHYNKSGIKEIVHVDITENEIWLLMKNFNNDIILTRIFSERQRRDCPIPRSREFETDKSEWLVSVHAKSVMKTQSATCSVDTSTHFWGYYDCIDKPITESVEIQGKGLCWTKDGRYVLLWTVTTSGEHTVKLHLNENIIGHRRSHRSEVVSFSLGQNLFSVKAQIIERSELSQLINQQDETTRNVIEPVFALLVVHSSGVECIVWDTKLNRVLYEIEFFLNKWTLTVESQIEFCFSPNLKWIGIGCWKDGVIGLFSTISGVCVWQNPDLQLHSVSSSLFVPIKFDPESSKLIVNSGRQLYIFIPPCFLKDHSTFFNHKRYNHDFNTELSNEAIEALKVFPKSVFFNVLMFILGNVEDSRVVDMFDVATSATSSNLAVLWNSQQRLCILILPIKAMFTSEFKNWLVKAFQGGKYTPPHNYKEVGIKKKLRSELHSRLVVFLYQQTPQSGDSLALFSFNDETLVAIFTDLESEPQEVIQLFSDTIFDIKQTQDGTRVLFLCTHCIRVLSLVDQDLRQTIDFKVSLSRRWNSFIWKIKWFWYFHLSHIEADDVDLVIDCASTFFIQQKRRGLFDISDDGRKILIGWDHSSHHPLILSNETTELEFNEMMKQCDDNKITSCYTMDSNFSKLIFTRTDENNEKCFDMVLYRSRDGAAFPLDAKLWKASWTRILTERRDVPHMMYLRLDDTGQSLWTLAMQETKEHGARMEWFPISTYSGGNSLPSLDMLDLTDVESKDTFINNFGISVFNMEFDGMTNLRSVCCLKDNKHLLSQFFEAAQHHGLLLGLVWSQGSSRTNLLSESIESKDINGVRTALSMVKEQLSPFASSGKIMKDSFKDLWTNYHDLFAMMLVNNELAFQFSEVVNTSAMFNSANHPRNQLGTSDQFSSFRNKSNNFVLERSCKSLEGKFGNQVKVQDQMTTSKAVLKVFCIENVCKIGFNGILRLLLMQNAPSNIYKTELVRSVICWKMKYIWRARALAKIKIYTIFVAIFSSYAILIGYLGDHLLNEIWKPILIVLLLVVLMVMALLFLREEYIQVKTYIRDGRVLSKDRPSCGLWHYLHSKWNQLELLSYFLILVVIPILQFFAFLDSNIIPGLYAIIAIESILLWTKVWYFAQSYRVTGALVLLIENVVRDCFPFLFLAGVVLLGFSIGLFVLFQNSLKDFHEHNADDDIKKVHNSFGTPWNSIETLFYAMIGTFEPEIYRSGETLTPLITLIFILYVVIQLIVMLNMLISIMSDTFDKVKSREEEQLLMGRARFIDACEASLTKNEIDKIEDRIGKYLYVLEPQGDSYDGPLQWEGKLKSIEDNVRKMIAKCEKDVTEKIDKSEQDIKKEVNANIKELEKKIDRLNSLLSIHLSKTENDYRSPSHTFLHSNFHSSIDNKEHKDEAVQTDSTDESKNELEEMEVEEFYNFNEVESDGSAS